MGTHNMMNPKRQLPEEPDDSSGSNDPMFKQCGLPVWVWFIRLESVV
tara:strand:+ start:558 stop:698 length:141 start_codon:yes stop_codon:yes gene_type:complete